MRVFIVDAYGQIGQLNIRSLKSIIWLENIVCSDARLSPKSVKIVRPSLKLECP